MALRLTIPNSQLNELLLIREIAPEKYAELLVEIGNQKQPILRSGELRVICERILPEEIARALVHQLVALAALGRQGEYSPKEVTSAITSGLQALPSARRWQPDAMSKWKAVEPRIEQLLSLEAIATIEKTLNLAFEYANLFRDARIITDVRPVFTSDRKAIHGVLVSHLLTVTFDSASNINKIEIALDEKDVRNLMKRCEEALVKGTTAKRIMEDAGYKSVITGTDDDAN